jgi:hypothetical protein
VQCLENPAALVNAPSLVAASGIFVAAILDGAEGRRKIEQQRRTGCSRSLAEASSCSPADGSSYSEVANSGTMVRVLASIPAGGVNEGGTASVTVVPPWFGAWCARRGHCAAGTA